MTKTGFDISALVDDLRPVQPVRTVPALLLAAMISLVGIAAISLLRDFRVDLLAGQPTAMFLMRAGILAMLGGATAYSVLAMAKPSVGKQNSGWIVAVAFAALFPLGGIIALMTGDDTLSTASTASVYRCFGFSSITALATAIPIVLALRRGAPTNAKRAGWLTGLAAGGMGAFAYSFFCPFDSLAYTGLWFTLAVGIASLAGRIIVPPMIRW
ncbi:NrsF family protein [Sphingorhabdus arenilitoris]|uniref:NrsF family protein n=1 Tax=Sphingorhabdus arenilitoris TaxID=1490041 RepID=A0ABV8RDR2_9SPHN